jgi:arginine deiminase
MGLQAQETVEMVYPQAEWSKVGDILMHTPGQELFNGVIHPSAGLFEDYFDVEKAADVHTGS